MLDYRSTFVAAGAFMGALLVGCGDPDLPTDLRTSGPPNITAVTVMSDLQTSLDPDSEKAGGLGRYLEDATFCRLNDDKRPGLVGLADIRTTRVCPVDLKMGAMNEGVAQAAPPVWFVRIVFDKLLDPSIEDLDTSQSGDTFGTFKNTQPVTLRCNDVDIAYDGYYVPNGNKESWPLGPDLFIKPITPTDAPTGATCTVAVKDNVHNKAGQSVPTDQRSYTFKLAPMSFRFSDPAPDDKHDGSLGVDPRTPIELFFTAELKVAGTVTTTTTSPMGVKVTSTINLSDLDLSKVELTSAPNQPDGSPTSAVCDGAAGTPVNPLKIRAYRRGPLTADDSPETALVLRLDAGGDLAGPTAQMDQVWEPSTTYLLTFAPGAAVSPKQGGGPGALPGADDFSLCFHTTAIASN
jgi:hypothetical protein